MTSAEKVQQFFAWQDVLTLSGSVTVTILVTNTIGSLFGHLATDALRRWLAFIVAQVCSYAAAVYANTGHQHLHGYQWLLAAVNGALIYASALGINQTAVILKPDPHGQTIRAQTSDERARTRRNFFRSWI